MEKNVKKYMYDLYVNNQWGLKHEKQSFEYQEMMVHDGDFGTKLRIELTFFHAFFTVPLGPLGFKTAGFVVNPRFHGVNLRVAANPAMVNHDGKNSRPVDRFQHPEMGIRP